MIQVGIGIAKSNEAKFMPSMIAKVNIILLSVNKPYGYYMDAARGLIRQDSLFITKCTCAQVMLLTDDANKVYKVLMSVPDNWGQGTIR